MFLFFFCTALELCISGNIVSNRRYRSTASNNDPCEVFSIRLQIQYPHRSWWVLSIPRKAFICNSKCDTYLGPYIFVAICTTINTIVALHDSTPVSSLCLTRTAVLPGFYDYILLLRIACVFISAITCVLIVVLLNKVRCLMVREHQCREYTTVIL